MTREEKRRHRKLEKERFDHRVRQTFIFLGWLFFAPVMLLYKIRKWFIIEAEKNRMKDRERNKDLWGWWFFD